MESERSRGERVWQQGSGGRVKQLTDACMREPFLVFATFLQDPSIIAIGVSVGGVRFRFLPFSSLCLLVLR